MLAAGEAPGDASVVWDDAANVAAGLVPAVPADALARDGGAASAVDATLAGISSAAAARAALETPGAPGLAAVMARLSDATRVPEALLPGLLKLPSTMERRVRPALPCALHAQRGMSWLLSRRHLAHLRLTAMPPRSPRSPERVAEAASGLLSWRTSLQRCGCSSHRAPLLTRASLTRRASLARSGLLPSAEVPWPRDAVFREALLEAMGSLDMARFTRRHPALLDTLLANVLDVLAVYEAERQEVDGPEGAGGEEQESGKAEPQAGGVSSGGAAEENAEQQQEQEAGGGGGGGAGAGEAGENGDAADAADAAVDASEFAMDGDDGDAGQASDAAQAAAAAANKELAERIADEFKRAWDPLIDKLDAAGKAFEGFDLSDLSDERHGFDRSAGVWHATGWKELDALRRKLEARAVLCVRCVRCVF